MSFFKSILRRVKRTAQAQISGQVSSFVGRNVSNLTNSASRGLQSKVDAGLNNITTKIKNRVQLAQLREVTIKSKRPPGF
jgi:hypothetical protein